MLYSRVHKKLEVESAMLFSVQLGQRHLINECDASIEIREVIDSLPPILGKGKQIKKRDIVLLITYNHKPDILDIDSIDRIEFSGEIVKSDGVRENIIFDTCIPEDGWNISCEGRCTVEVRCSEGTI